VLSSRTRCRHRPRHPRAGAMRRARHRPRFARPDRRRRSRASLRLVAAALRASTVPASPDTGFRTAPCTTVRMTADSAVAVSGSVLRTTARGSRRTDRHSIAVAAPLRRLRRRRFPFRSPSDSWLFGRRSAFRLHTPRIADAGVPPGAMSCPFGVFRCRAGPCGCWTERVARATHQSSPACHRVAPTVRQRSAHRPLRGPKRVPRVLRRAGPPSPPVTDRSARAVREMARTPPFRGERCAQSGASSRSDSSNARASTTSFSSSSPRPSRSIAPRFSVARNQV